jgi:RNA-directed DNA polymerase
LLANAVRRRASLTLSASRETSKVTKMIEQVINQRNMHLAYKQVFANKGSAGVDGLKVSELKHHIRKEREAIVLSIINGGYLPQPILGVNIRKSNGKTRLLGIPTVTDRWLQQAIAQTITPLFEFEFKDHSYGFRPSKHAHQCSNHSSIFMKVTSTSSI